MAKKTHPVADLLAFANYQLARTDEFATVDFKCGICSMIERVLHDTGNYEGFGFLDNNDRETGHSVTTVDSTHFHITYQLNSTLYNRSYYD